MLSYAHGPEAPILEKTIHEAFADAVRLHPDNVALVVPHQNVRLTVPRTVRPGGTHRAWLCEGRIAHFKIPAYIRFVDSFPLTVTGKIQKFRIRQQEIAERGLEEIAKVKTA